MNQGKDGKGITEWPMDDVPQVKDLLRLAEEDNPARQGALLPDQANDVLNLRISARDQPAQ